MPKSDPKQEYSLYLASGITLWKTYFKEKYSKFFNRKVYLFEPGTINTPTDHRLIPIEVACYDLNEVNHADALLVYMKYYKSLDGAPIGTDSTWECGYAISKEKPVIMLIENKEHINYYDVQWMVSFSINAILTTDKEVAEVTKNHPKFVHTTILLAENPEQFETRIIEYLDEYYRSIYSRSGIINYHVDDRARELFSKEDMSNLTFSSNPTDTKIVEMLKPLRNLKLKSDIDFLKVCKAEREISKYFQNILIESPITLSENKVDSAISSVIKEWGAGKKHILNCLEHSIKPPFLKVKGRKQGVKKTRPELFFELYDLVTHHLVYEQRFIKNPTFPYEVGAVIELYNWMNTYALDDVFDNSEHRQNLKTIWRAFSRKDAIYTGILGHLLTLKYLFIIASENKNLARKLAEIMNNYNLMMYEGQVLDLVLTFDSTKKRTLLKKTAFEELLKVYVQRIYGICGGFYEAVGELSAKAGNKEKQIFNAEEIDEISPLVSMYYGIIQMIRNDLGDYVIVEEVSKLSKSMKGVSHSDVQEGKTNMAYLISLYSDKLTKKEKDFLLKCLNKKLALKDKLKINELLWKSGSIDLVVEMIIKIINHVKSTLLHKYQETPTRMKWMFDLVEITKEILIPFKKQALKYKWLKYEYNPKTLDFATNQIINLEKTPKENRLSKFKKFVAGYGGLH